MTITLVGNKVDGAAAQRQVSEADLFAFTPMGVCASTRSETTSGRGELDVLFGHVVGVRLFRWVSFAHGVGSQRMQMIHVTLFICVDWTQ